MRGIALLLSASALLGTYAWAQDKAQLPTDCSGFHHIVSLAISATVNPLFGFHHFYINEKGWETFRSQGPYPYPNGPDSGAAYDVESPGHTAQ